jgi:folate-binding protein YgfZ
MGPDDNGRMNTDTLPGFPFDGCVALPHWGVIRAQGPDAATFLHGQLTQDVMQVDAQAGLAGYCSVKGRLLASFIVWRSGTDELMLACSADVLAATLKRLSMFVMRAKCKLSDATGEVRLHGLVGPAALSWLGNAAPSAAWERSELASGGVASELAGAIAGAISGALTGAGAGAGAAEGASENAGAGQVIRLPDVQGVPRFIWAAPADASVPDMPALALDAWSWLEVRSGVPQVVAATADQFVPQMVNLELVGGVSFRKGCFPGQEVVARSQYRGTLKRRAFLFDCAAAAQPGTDVYASNDPGQPAGMVANAATLGDRHCALVSLKIAALDAPSLHLGSVDGPALQHVELPYAVALEAVD